MNKKGVTTSPDAVRALSNSLLPEEIQRYLLGGKLGAIIEYHESLDSTNERAKELAALGKPEGLVVIGERQKKGKGRLGRDWHSPQGTGIYLSVIIRPPLKPDKVSGFTLLGAVALAKAIFQITGFKVGIKWPNDLLADGKKIAGILTEMKGEKGKNYSLILGVGVNVNTDFYDMPPTIRDTATSLKAVLGKELLRAQLAGIFLQTLERLYVEYLEEGLESVLKEWKEWNITLGQWVTVSSGTEKYFGQAVDLDATGALLVKGKGGKVRSFISGEVTLKN